MRILDRSITETSAALLLTAIVTAWTGIAVSQQVRLEQWPYLLAYPQVQDELKISGDQMRRIQRTVEQAESKRLEIDALQKRVQDVLTPEQRNRYDQIRYQVLYTRGALPGDLVERLGLSSDQSKALADAIETNQEANRELLHRLATENLRKPGARDELKKRYYEQARERLHAVLTPQQRDALKPLLGDDFPAAFELAESF